MKYKWWGIFVVDQLLCKYYAVYEIHYSKLMVQSIFYLLPLNYPSLLHVLFIHPFSGNISRRKKKNQILKVINWSILGYKCKELKDQRCGANSQDPTWWVLWCDHTLAPSCTLLRTLWHSSSPAKHCHHKWHGEMILSIIISIVVRCATIVQLLCNYRAIIGQFVRFILNGSTHYISFFYH